MGNFFLRYYKDVGWSGLCFLENGLIVMERRKVLMYGKLWNSMENRIEKKVWPKYFQAIVDGKKTYELRLADFDVKEGDVLILREWNPETKEYTGRVIEKEVTYVSKTKGLSFWSEEDIEKYGYQVIGFK